MRFISTLAFVVCLASSAQAKYVSATFLPNMPMVQANGLIYAEVVLEGDSGEPSIQRQFTANSKDDLFNQIVAALDVLNTSATDAKSLSKGGTVPLPTVTPPPPPPPPTAEQQFFADLTQLRTVQIGLQTMGRDPSTVKSFTDLQAKVAAEFQDSYVNDPGWPSK